LRSGVFEIALPFKGDAFRVVYAVQIADEIWVVRFPEEVDAGRQDAQTRDRPHQRPFNKAEGDVAMKKEKLEVALTRYEYTSRTISAWSASAA
jgi:hypothetical protein